MRVRNAFIALFMLAGVTTAAVAQPGMEEMMKMAQPGPQHELLKGLTGNWKYELTSYFDPAKPEKGTGTAKGTMMLGDRFMRFESFGRMMGMSANTFSLMGYDNRKSRYFVVECDEMGTYTIFAEGTYDAATKTMTLRGENEEGGQKVPFEFIYKLIDKDHMSFSIVFEFGGQRMKMVDITYARTKG